ncbi:CaiB/BaiF CoA transferase family protein [Pseudonocardia lacus]|uniref:CaiB/BaiF CoA transferase family protein n=1 Tax=Pseudonocardia lacus TaxID=2835865 RepID=UPI001BDBF170|nr:CoA transferase [Pseudonocardia lacus]
MTAPLHGTTVLELAEGVAGPYLGEQLAMAGADVVKVETGAGDCSRGWVPLLDAGLSGPFVALNQGKRSIRADAADPRLIAWADVVITDDTHPGAGWFGGPQGIGAANPRVVCCSISGYGPDGPAGGEAGGDLPAEMASGASASMGEPGGPPVRMPDGYPSAVAADYAVQAVVAALLERETSGLGQLVDVSLLGAMITMRSTLWVAHSDPDEWWGFHLDNAVKRPYRGHRTASGQAYISVGGQAFDDGLADRLGIPEIGDDLRWPLARAEGINPGSRHTDELADLWVEPLSRFTVDELRDLLAPYGGQVQPANTYPELVESPAAQAVGLVREFDQPGVGRVRGIAAHWEFDGAKPPPLGGAPLLGEHTEQVLAELGGPTGTAPDEEG